MEKQELKEQWTEETIREYVKQAAKSEPIPDKLQPRQMEKWLKQAMEEKGGKSMKEKREKELPQMVVRDSFDRCLSGSGAVCSRPNHRLGTGCSKRTGDKAVSGKSGREGDGERSFLSGIVRCIFRHLERTG